MLEEMLGPVEPSGTSGPLATNLMQFMGPVSRVTQVDVVYGYIGAQ